MSIHELASADLMDGTAAWPTTKLIYLTHKDPQVLERHLEGKVCVRPENTHRAFLVRCVDNEGMRNTYSIGCYCDPLPPILGKPQNPLLEAK